MYDFTTCADRTDVGSFKYLDMYKKNPDLSKDIVPLSVADMEFLNAPEIKEGLKKYIDDSVLGYTGPTDGFYDAVIGWMTRRHDYEIKKEWIILSDGVVPALGDLIRAVTKPKDNIIICSPVYYPFKNSIEANDRVVADVPLISDGASYTLDFEGLEKAASDPATTAIIFCSPHNPVGRVWTRDELLRVYKICEKNKVFIIDDEIHGDLIMPGCEHTVMANIAPGAGKNMAVCTAPSKTFNLAGLQTSSIIIEDEAIRAAFLRSKKQVFRMSPNMLGMEACRIAYTKAQDWLDECIEVISGNAMYMESFFKEHLPDIRVFPLQGTYLLWCDFRSLGMDYKELEEFMVKKALLFTDEGYLFGDNGKGFERFNIACPRHILEAATDRLLNALANRKGNSL